MTGKNSWLGFPLSGYVPCYYDAWDFEDDCPSCWIRKEGDRHRMIFVTFRDDADYIARLANDLLQDVDNRWVWSYRDFPERDF